jgi:hypothetical protein
MRAPSLILLKPPNNNFVNSLFEQSFLLSNLNIFLRLGGFYIEHPVSSGKFTEEAHCIGRLTKESFVYHMECEFERLFGHTGIMMVQKVIQHYKPKDELTVEDAPILIELLVASVEQMLSPNKSVELRERLKRRCGLE